MESQCRRLAWALQHLLLWSCALRVVCCAQADASLACVGWQGTDGCDPSASPAPNRRRDCREAIPAGEAGSCDCGDGVSTAWVPCAHDEPLTCEGECGKLDRAQRMTRAGRQMMGSHKLALVVVVPRPHERFVPPLLRLAPLVESTGALFSSYSVRVVVETGPDTNEGQQLAALRAWESRNAAVSVVLHAPGESRGEEGVGGDRLVELRNACLGESADFVAVLDPERVVGWDVDGIAHSIGLRGDRSVQATAPNRKQDFLLFHQERAQKWDVVCSNGVAPGRGGTHADNAPFRNAYFTELSWRAHEDVVHDPLDEAEQVESCFGGLALYTKEAWGPCRYSLHHSGVPGTEHIGLHACLREKHRRVVFNPRQVVHFQDP